MSQPEKPWTPDPGDVPWSTALINPHGDRHLGFDSREGRFYRIWQYRSPEPLHTGEAILLRPSDIDQIIRLSVIWIMKHADSRRSRELTDEIALGSKAVVLHFASVS